MKALIIGFYTKTYMPYILKYEEILKKNNIDYDITCFDRDSTGDETQESNVFTYHRKMGTQKWRKIFPYFSYISYVKRIIKNKEYDRIIVLTTIPAVLLYNTLTHTYQNRYIFDFRDYSYENYSVYRKLVNSIVEKSFCSFISSKGFLHYLKDSTKLNLVHNISNQDAGVSYAEEIDINHIVIGFVGYVRYYDVNTRLIKQLKDCSNIMIRYYGTVYDDCDLKTYVLKNEIHNVEFYDTYQNEEKPKIYSSITFINSIYSLQSKEVAFAIPNRLYDAALYKKPIIVASNTYLEKIVSFYKIGFSVDLTKQNIHEEIANYIKSYNADTFARNCRRFLSDVLNDDQVFYSKVTQFLTEEKENE